MFQFEEAVHYNIENGILPSGYYFVGDFSTVMKPTIYQIFLDNKSAYGTYHIFEDNQEIGWFAVVETYSSDDEYRDQLGNKYDIKAEIIGIVSESLCDNIKEHQLRNRVVKTAPPGHIIHAEEQGQFSMFGTEDYYAVEIKFNKEDTLVIQIVH